MKASGLNSIEFVLQFLGRIWKIAGYIALIIVVGPVLYLLWSWNTMSFQSKAIDALNSAASIHVTLDFNQALLVPIGNQTMVFHVVKAGVPNVIPQNSVAWMEHWLPWAPGMPPDPNEANPDTSLGNYEPLCLDNYRRPKDIAHADPWYLHGLMKLAPTKHWDDRTGPDYAFGKVTGNYLAYAGAVRAVAAMRYLLGGVAAGQSDEDLAERASASGGLHLLIPDAAFKVSGSTKARRFLIGYATDFQGKLPVITLDLQMFNDDTWNHQADLRNMRKDSVEWDDRMGWWGGPGAGNGGSADNNKDFFITGIRLQGDGPLEGRPQFAVGDFLLNHLPSSTFSEDRSRNALNAMTTDAFWDTVLANPAIASGAHNLLRQVREDLEKDRLFARKYGQVLFSGDKFGRGPSIMKEE